MPEDETGSANPETLPASQPLAAANDNGANAKPTVDPRILVVARAIGRQIAREQLGKLEAANDNTLHNE